MHFDKVSGLMIFDRLGIEAVYPGWSKGRGPCLGVHDLIQDLPGLDRVWGALTRGGVSLKCDDGIIILIGLFLYLVMMHVEAVVVHLDIIFALTEVKQGHISLASFSHFVSLNLTDSDFMTWVVGCNPENCFVNYAGYVLRGEF